MAGARKQNGGGVVTAEGLDMEAGMMECVAETGSRSSWLASSGSPGVGTETEVLEPVWESWLAPGSRYRRVHGFARGRVRAPGLLGVPSLSIRELLWVERLRDGGVHGAVGIDMSKRAAEVRKLFYAGGFTGTLLKERIDPEDFLQEVYKGLITRNDGTCPWDHKKSSFGHYVHIVMRCVLSNYLRKHRRTSTMEGVTDDGELKDGVSREAEGGDVFHRQEILRDLFPREEELALATRLVDLMGEGRGRKEAAEALGVGQPVVDGMLRRIRQGLQG